MNDDPESMLPPLSSSPSGDRKVLPKEKGPVFEIGPYKVVREIDRGGMGVVYLAIQSQPVEREVALKVIQHPSLAKTIAAECKSLAAMSHPNVAVIFDGGVDAISKMPYFAMEYVDGSQSEFELPCLHCNMASSMELRPFPLFRYMVITA